MWLINTYTLQLEDFYVERVPPYAILSHTWGDSETSFAHLMNLQTKIIPNTQNDKLHTIVNDKIVQTCRLALEHGLEYAWVDTCCIDKRSSAELSEAINSMYRWYKEATMCFVYLEDLPTETDIEEGLGRCRWPTRGWTLQELIAPFDIWFYDSAWCLRGRKLELRDILAAWTGLPGDLLAGKSSIDYYAVASKMSWASRRNTTRLEDTAYCLMGIFDVNMPLLYGEGTKAFQRLQEEIIKKQADLSILAWQDELQISAQPIFTRLFAESPKAFAGLQSDRKASVLPEMEVSVTQRGLVIETEGHCARLNPGSVSSALTIEEHYILDVTESPWVRERWDGFSVPLRQVNARTFARSSRQCSEISRYGKDVPNIPFPKLCIVANPTAATVNRAKSHELDRLHIPFNLLPGHDTLHTYPRSTWDRLNNGFYRSIADLGNIQVIVLRSRYDDVSKFIVMYGDLVHLVFKYCKIITRVTRQDSKILCTRFQSILDYANNISWPELLQEIPELNSSGDTLEVTEEKGQRNPSKKCTYIVDYGRQNLISSLDGESITLWCLRTKEVEQTPRLPPQTSHMSPARLDNRNNTFKDLPRRPF